MLISNFIVVRIQGQLFVPKKEDICNSAPPNPFNDIYFFKFCNCVSLSG